ncbi:MAG: SpoIID/LytB domain-containing protein [Elusimicrobiales bacterium]|jgi:stage II sporulation protein D
MKRIVLYLLTALTLPSFAADSGEGNSAVIRVAVSRNTSQFKLSTSGKVYALEVGTGQKYMLLEKSVYEVKYVGPSRLALAGATLESPVRLLAADGGDRIKLNGRFYKGELYLKTAAEEKLEVIEHLSVEDYLYGVLPVEMSPDWPLEALKAQAVASRTYALKNANPKKDYDMTDGVDTQVYNGASAMSPRIIDAVNSTRGEVLKYKGKLLTAFFHACCGGHTASANSAWGEEVIKPLYGVKDPFCSGSRHYNWEYYATARDILSFIQKRGSSALKVKSVRVYKRDRSGRALKLRFLTDSGAFAADAADLRKAFGNYDIKSTYITRIAPAKNGYEFFGKGWGHGVGMCQEGAKRMALNGRNYKKILRQYYPGASITDVD